MLIVGQYFIPVCQFVLEVTQASYVPCLRSSSCLNLQPANSSDRGRSFKPTAVSLYSHIWKKFTWRHLEGPITGFVGIVVKARRVHSVWILRCRKWLWLPAAYISKDLREVFDMLSLSISPSQILSWDKCSAIFASCDWYRLVLLCGRGNLVTTSNGLISQRALKAIKTKPSGDTVIWIHKLRITRLSSMYIVILRL